ncbi:MAG: glycosyltransferase family A protein [Pirellulaceae bacterium]|nr:glycosyltransferase family 2 protein [Planctomycetaceae bacterium]MDG2381234.1 glycosyltransferase family A protein [Pirellulaceae bacterium]
MCSCMISVIVCVGRDIRFLGKALESIRQQTRMVDELVIVAAETTPNAVANVIDGFAPNIFETQSEPGLAAARNLGVSLASGEVITFLDADDLWTPQKTEIQAECLNRQRPIVLGNLRRFPDDVSSERDFPSGFFTQDQAAMTPGGIMISRAELERLGPFSTHYTVASDHEWFVRLRRSDAVVHRLNEVVLEKRIHTENLSHKVALYRKEIMDMLRSGRQN